MKFLVYVLVFSVFLGTYILSIPLGVAQLSLYRFMLIVVSFTTLFQFTKNDESLNLSVGDRLSPYQMVYLFWLFYALVSVLWVESISRWVFGAFFVGSGVLSIFFITFYIRKKDEVKILFHIVLYLTLFHQIIGWIEQLSRSYVWRTGAYRAPISIFGNINDYATLLLAGIFIALLVLLTTSKLYLKIICLFQIITGIPLLFLGGSRANQLGLLVGIGILLITSLLTHNMSKNFMKILFSLVMLGLILLVLSSDLRVLAADSLRGLLHEIFNRGGSNSYRVNLLLNGLAFLIQTYGFGVGAGNVEYWMQNRPVFSNIDAPNLHNWFMDILSGYGLIVFTVYLIMYIYIIRKLYINYKYSNDFFIKKASWVLLAYVIAFIFSSMSSASNIFIEWQWVFWGIIIAFVQYTESSEKTATISTAGQEV